MKVEENFTNFIMRMKVNQEMMMHPLQIKLGFVALISVIGVLLKWHFNTLQ